MKVASVSGQTFGGKEVGQYFSEMQIEEEEATR